MSGVTIFIHPGTVKSKNDGDIHRIYAGDLENLYGLRRWPCVPRRIIRPDTVGYGRKDDPNHVHLFPSYEGNYTLPPSIVHMLDQAQAAAVKGRKGTP